MFERSEFTKRPTGPQMGFTPGSVFAYFLAAQKARYLAVAVQFCPRLRNAVHLNGTEGWSFLYV